MHIPDGFLDTKTIIASAALAAGGLGFALYHARKTLPPRKMPLLGLAAAFVFAAQMINFPIPGGTSGHLIGGVLVAALLGPSAAVIVISTVLIVQCFAFADGGVFALGANILNMGIICGVFGWMIYALISRFVSGLFGRILAAIVASWVSVVVAAIVCAGELATSKEAPWSVAFPAMASVHAVIGIGEGIITALVLVAIASARPELILPKPGAETEARSSSLKPILVYGILAALGVALFVSPFADNDDPDGLEKVAQTLGLEKKEPENSAVAAPVPDNNTPGLKEEAKGSKDHPQWKPPALAPDYKIPGIGSDAVATGLAGLAGTLVVLGGAWLLARALVPRAKSTADSRVSP